MFRFNQNTTAEISQWIERRNREVVVNVEEVPFADLTGWHFDRKTGNLVHDSGKFFSIVGLDVITNTGSVSRWSQPIINQPEVGYLRYLFLLVIASPFVRKLANVPGLIALFILYGAICPTTWLVTLLCPTFWLYGFSLLGLFYFTLGIYLRRNPAALCMKRTPAIVSLLVSLAFLRYIIFYCVRVFQLQLMLVTWAFRWLCWDCLI